MHLKTNKFRYGVRKYTRLLREQHVSEDPAGSAFLPRWLKPCPRNAKYISKMLILLYLLFVFIMSRFNYIQPFSYLLNKIHRISDYFNLNFTVFPLEISFAASSRIGPISTSNDLSFKIFSYCSASIVNTCK